MGKFTKGMNSDDRSIPQGDYRPAGEIELGTCDVCHKKEVAVSRKYYKYPIPCDCCNKLGIPPHLEIVRYCKDCTPVPPRRISVIMVRPLPDNEIAADQMDPAGAPILRQALHAMKRNIEIAAAINLSVGTDQGLSTISLLYKQIVHRREVANRLLSAARELQPDGVIKYMHDVFEYDQEQIRQLLGLTED